MAWQIGHNVVRGVLDNRRKGLVTGMIWLKGSEQPVTLELHGNFLRDMAGREITFENPSPGTSDSAPMEPFQVGMTGDMTASRRILITDPDDVAPARRTGEIVRRIANALFIEWFSETNGRIVIESTVYKLSMSPADWEMTPEEESDQIAANRESFRDWLERLGALEQEEEEPNRADMTYPMNEFEWERIMKESDRKNEMLGEALEKYHGHPDSEKLIAREMGWTWVEEELEAQERGVFLEDDDLEAFDDFDEDPVFDEMPEPDPAREGELWVRDVDGSIEHPLALRALNASEHFWQELEGLGILHENADPRVYELAGFAEAVAMRLSTTLNDLALGDDVEPGYLIAGLKRAAHKIHQAIALAQDLTHAAIIPLAVSAPAIENFFSLRHEIITMIGDFRRKAATEDN